MAIDLIARSLTQCVSFTIKSYKIFKSIPTDLDPDTEFDRLRENLIKSFPHAHGSIPQLPRKSVVSRFRPRFLEQRKNGLNHFVR